MSDANEAKPIQEPIKPRRRTPAWLAVVLIAIAIGIFFWKLPSSNYGDDHRTSRMISSNNLKQFGLAMQAYDSAFGGLPPRAICGKDGKPLLSWRVAILPYMELDNIYNQFKLDEPWDSPNNKPLIEKMPKVYWNRTKPEMWSKGLTNYKVFSGNNTAFDKPVLVQEKFWRNALTMDDLAKSPRGASNIILVVEAGDPVIWTKPEDIDYDADKPMPVLKPIYQRGILALKADGSVFSVTKDFKESAMRASIDPNSTSKESLE
jgi:hypothetical protein